MNTNPKFDWAHWHELRPYCLKPRRRCVWASPGYCKGWAYYNADLPLLSGCTA